MGDGPFPTDERRRHLRRRVNARAKMELVGYVAEGRLEDVSTGGLRFRTEDANLQAEPGNYVYVHFDVAGDAGRETLRRAVQLRWMSRDGIARIFGMEFEEDLELVGAVA